MIDHIAGISIDPELGGNELSSLCSLSAGLGHLHAMVSTFESRVNDRGSTLLFAFGKIPGLPPQDAALLPSLFHWYGVSVCNYARLVGFLSGLATGAFSRQTLEDESQFGKITTFCDSYVSGIVELSAVKQWRDKVAAHFAITAPRRKHDNVALLDYSVMPSVGFDARRFRANIWQFVRTDSQGREHSASLPPWAITEVHEGLSPRYWPALK